MPQNSMAVGNNVYNGGSNAAQRSQTLNPGGYIQRGLKQAAQKEMQQGPQGIGINNIPGQPSQQRSGIAQNAMSQMQMQPPPTRKIEQGMGTGDPNVGGLAPLNLASMSPLTSQIKSFDTSAPQFSSAAPTVKLPGVPTSVTGSLKSPLDTDLRNQRDVGYNALNDSITQLQSLLEQASAEYQMSVRDFGNESKENYGQLASLYAAMGGGPGTGYGQSYQDLTRDMTNFRNDLDSAFSRSQQDILSDRTSAVNRFQTQIRGLSATQADRDAKKRAEAKLKQQTAAKKKADAAKKAAAAKKSSTSYKIKSGDTLSAIAKKHKTTVAKLMKLNPQIKNKHKIIAGKSLKLK